MPTYITLFLWTRKGIEHFRESPSRLERAKEEIKTFGGEIKAFYMTLGSYDNVFIAEAPDDESYAKFMLSLASKGNVQSETLRAFTEDEFRKIVRESSS